MQPTERIKPLLKVVEEAMLTTPQSALLARIFEKPKDIEKDVRTNVFRLEALFRIYRKDSENEEDLYRRFKTLEDAVGHYGETYENLAYATAAKAPPAVLDYLEKVKLEERENFLNFLKEERWSGHDPQKKGALEKTLATLANIEWRAYREDRDFLFKEIAKDCEKVAEKTEKEKYDLNEVEKGIHELRRNLRWFLIDVAALRGLIELDGKNCPHEVLAADAKDKSLTESPFAVIPKTESGNLSCRLPACLFFGLSRAVRDLGWMKDTGLAIEFLTDALRKTGTKKSEASEQAAALAFSHPDYLALKKLYPKAKSLKEMAATAQERLQKTKLMELIAQKLRDCL